MPDEDPSAEVAYWQARAIFAETRTQKARRDAFDDAAVAVARIMARGSGNAVDPLHEAWEALIRMRDAGQS